MDQMIASYPVVDNKAELVSAFSTQDADLPALIQRDQLVAARRNVGRAIPINIVLGLACLLVALLHGQQRTGIVWFAASTLMNAVRIVQGRWYMRGADSTRRDATEGATASSASIPGHLRLFSLTALLSGLVWACIPLLCAGYTNSQTLFYLTVVCGTTAGAVTHGTGYARMPISFITPPLLSVAGCLLSAGGTDRYFLAATVLVYLGALIRFSHESERAFRDASRAKNEATTLASSLKTLHEHSLHVSEQLRHFAWHDALTGLLNRAGFLQAVEQHINVQDRVFCFMLLDLDGFKAINDVFGHRTGDQVLTEIARRLSKVLSEEDLIGRLGGDEFAILHFSKSPEVSTADLASRLIQSIRMPIFESITLGASIGIHSAIGVAALDRLAYADEALYAAKSAGRNQFRYFDEALLIRLERRRDIERDLASALNDTTVEVWFQPIFDEGGQRLESLEALLRWNHPVHGWISAPDLIFTAAVNGLSELLLRYILTRVCNMIQQLCAAGQDHLRVAINMSPREMAQVRIETVVPEILSLTNVPLSMLEIEITEETSLDNDQMQARLAILCDMGVRIAVDDFGVGFSSLASLRNKNVHRVKIDRSFVTGLADALENQVLVEAVLQLGRSLEIDIVAEGVETESDLIKLRALGCTTMQGYYLSRPMPSADVIPWLQLRQSLLTTESGNVWRSPG